MRAVLLGPGPIGGGLKVRFWTNIFLHFNVFHLHIQHFFEEK